MVVQLVKPTHVGDFLRFEAAGMPHTTPAAPGIVYTVAKAALPAVVFVGARTSGPLPKLSAEMWQII